MDIRCCRSWTKKGVKRRTKAEKGKLIGIWECGLKFRLVNNIDIREPDYYLGIWTVKKRG